ncbi:MAG: undecaprenyl-diphosphatase UppP [Candidatus Falkowbacteria bacterium]
MNYIIVIILSIVQGITEFVPISSSGHLVLLHNILPQININELAFDVVLHAGTLLAVLIFFLTDIKNILIAWFKNLVGGKLNQDAKLGWLIILATIPAVLAGYFGENFIEQNLRSDVVVVIMLIIVGILFLVVERLAKLQDDLGALNWKKSLFIGCAQALALIPGTSRSGITIIAGMSTKLKREAALRFSFLMSAVIILGATIKKIPTMMVAISSGESLFSFVLGFLISFVVGYLVIKYFLIFIKEHSFVGFAYYRILLALIIITSWLI